MSLRESLKWLRTHGGITAVCMVIFSLCRARIQYGSVGAVDAGGLLALWFVHMIGVHLIGGFSVVLTAKIAGDSREDFETTVACISVFLAVTSFFMAFWPEGGGAGDDY